MRRVFIISITTILLLASKVKSQSYVYHHFADSVNTWEGSAICGFHGNNFTSNWINFLSGDTLIHDTIYHKINHNYFCFREDSNKRVFVIDMEYNQSERLLYDFSFVVSDSINYDSYLHFTVTQVDTLMYFGIPRRTLTLSGLHENDTWIEGIGSTRGPLGVWERISVYCSDQWLNCARRDSTSFYGCTSISSIFPIQNQEETISVFPNPCTTFFELQLLSPPADETNLQLYNALGQTVKTEIITSAVTAVNRDSLPSGIYFWQLQIRDKVLDRGKLIME